MLRRLAVLLTAALLCLPFVAGCDPYPPTATGTAEIWLEVHAHAKGYARVMFDASDRTRKELLETGRALAPMLFPKNSSVQVKVDANLGQPTFITINASGIYPDKRTTLWPFNGRPAAQYLLDHDIDGVSFAVWVQAKNVAGKWAPTGKYDHDGMWTWTTTNESNTAPVGLVAFDQ